MQETRENLLGSLCCQSLGFHGHVRVRLNIKNMLTKITSSFLLNDSPIYTFNVRTERVSAAIDALYRT
jgi:hypothetical protein